MPALTTVQIGRPRGNLFSTPVREQGLFEVIDRVEGKHKYFVIYFGTDADGGSKKGRVLLGNQRPWLFVTSCWAHQFQLILGDYFKVYPFAADIAEKATGLIGWINNHRKVRKIFDAVQARLSLDRHNRVVVLAYIVANLTRWTTHCVAFLRLLILREYLQFAVMESRGAIIAAQVGASKSTEAQRLKEDAVHHCDLISDSDFWNGLTSVVEDIEPICYGTNINQKDSTRPDQVLLTLAGLYLHYVNHPEPEISVGLVARLEKRWKDCDQPLFLVSLIVHPWEGLSCFGPLAKFDHIKATALVVETYTRVMSYPGNPDTPQQRLSKERNVSQTMFEYLSCTNGFQNFEDARDQFERAMGKDPIALWTALKASAGELALFAITILKVVVNQAGCERVFSDVGNTKSPRRSQTALAKLEKITKVNAGIKADHLLEGFTPANRQKRKNHKSVEKLLAVPHYRDLLEDQDAEDEDERGRALVGSTIGWRIEMAKWIADARAVEEADNSESEDKVESPTPISASTSRLRREKSAKWAKTTLAVLFGGAPKPVCKFTPDDIDEEAELMEALADAEEEARLDDSAIECSDDEYVP
ncbi:ribonuclease H-like domain-containing protein [Mycena galopus ATCC 62051]|nr:ribonuclease H-like domain-containing protein [Mycena galopus ATCC 62051]